MDGTFFPKNDYRLYLCHHGIKGQKWGIKHGPPYPIQKVNKKKIVEMSKSYKPSDKDGVSLEIPIFFGLLVSLVLESLR